ncbi:MAG: glycosyltransferase family 39 protein [Candidatus Falkowbacteria bacterium]|nr:glycosyltransferase family 39 protein [Candidatus Falkowbacteria bacterium]
MSRLNNRILALTKTWTWSGIIVLVLAFGFCLATSYYNYEQLASDGQIKWSSPDETANYFFTENFSATGSLSVFEPINLSSHDLVHPRSFRSDWGWLKPISFLGIILIFGKIAAWLGAWIIPYLTPIFAALGIIFFYGLVKRIFSERVALISAFLMATFPVYIYYTVRSMFHNVLFVVFVIIGFYFLAYFIDKKYSYQTRHFFSTKINKNIYLGFLLAFLAGIFFGLALMTRASELIWLGPLLFLVWVFNIRRAGWLKPILFGLGLILALLPAFYYNQILYSAPLYGGYGQMNQSLADISQAGKNLVISRAAFSPSSYQKFFTTLTNNIFYFGFNLKLSVKIFYYYFWRMFGWLLFLGFWGIMMLISDNFFHFKRRYLVYLLSLILTSTILIFYYGSWQFNDNPDPKSFTIGNSYTRYWLPIYLFFIPLASLFIVKIKISRTVIEPGEEGKYYWQRLPIYWSNALQMVSVLIIAFSSIIFVMFGSEEGLAYLATNNYAAKTSSALVVELTEPQAIIVTQYYDKFLFPERKVLVGLLNDDNMNYYYAQLAKISPLYYYNFSFAPKDIDYLNNTKLAKVNLGISLVKKIDQTFSLYKLSVVSSSPVLLPTGSQ